MNQDLNDYARQYKDIKKRIKNQMDELSAEELQHLKQRQDWLLEKIFATSENILGREYSRFKAVDTPLAKKQ